jgi:uracil phosphoribosyltransferase
VPFHLVEHPLAQNALLDLRDLTTEPPAFRRAAHRISLFLAAEALKDIPSRAAVVTTPLGVDASGQRVGIDVVVMPVLRAGMSMLDAVLELVPSARVGHVGLQRNETTAVASTYYSRLPPNLRDSYIVVIDPMLATGGSAVAAIDLIKAAGGRSIRLISIVAAPEGVAMLEERHPDVHVYAPVVDSHLNAQKYIVPGLGDFGDRLYGT